jgi:hypothetical protein
MPHPGLAADVALAAAIFAAVLVCAWGFFMLVERHFVRSVDTPKRPDPDPAPVPAPALGMAAASAPA